jgi:hypothetical protein
MRESLAKAQERYAKMHDKANYLQARADSLERIVRVLVEGASIEDDSIDINIICLFVEGFTPDDWALLRSLITPEGETGERA